MYFNEEAGITDASGNVTGCFACVTELGAEFLVTLHGHNYDIQSKFNFDQLFVKSFISKRKSQVKPYSFIANETILTQFTPFFPKCLLVVYHYMH